MKHMLHAFLALTLLGASSAHAAPAPSPVAAPAILGKAKWHTQPFDYQELTRYWGHVRALGNLPRQDTLHLLFTRAGFADEVRRWAGANDTQLLTPETMLASFNL